MKKRAVGILRIADVWPSPVVDIEHPRAQHRRPRHEETQTVEAAHSRPGVQIRADRGELACVDRFVTVAERPHGLDRPASVAANPGLRETETKQHGIEFAKRRMGGWTRGEEATGSKHARHGGQNDGGRRMPAPRRSAARGITMPHANSSAAPAGRLARFAAPPPRAPGR